jgi:putative membrane protein
MSELQNFRDKEANLDLAKKLNLLVWIISAAVLGLVVMMQKIKIPLPEGADLSSLPGFHALLNSMAAVFLILAIRAIKKGKVILHQKMIYAAFICSLVFLLSYVTYHITTPATLFGDANKDGLLSSAERDSVSGTRPYYLFILISHIGLAALSFPFILRTFVHAFTNQFEKHRKLSKKVFPVWLYVAVTGPVVYFFLQPYY